MSLASRVLSQLPKCIHNSIEAQLKHEPFLLEYCHSNFIQFLLEKIQVLADKVRSCRFNRRIGVRLSRFRCTLAPHKKRAKNCQLCSKTT